MKLKITYTPEEELEAAAVLAALQRLHPGARTRRDKSRAPLLAVYVVIDKKGPLRYNRPKE